MIEIRRSAILPELGDAAKQVWTGSVSRPDNPTSSIAVERVGDPRYHSMVERVFVIHLNAFDWNCPEHTRRIVTTF